MRLIIASGSGVFRQLPYDRGARQRSRDCAGRRGGALDLPSGQFAKSNFAPMMQRLRVWRSQILGSGNDAVYDDA